ncbi:hypothetical protein FHT39_001076 [Mitsuaria sp. BK045]|nr:hypothetical protein [Mitsuaria sp. BK041]MBB3361654.1 hypothetical protein [Mitsuaria sp. BK045]
MLSPDDCLKRERKDLKSEGRSLQKLYCADTARMSLPTL